jgi:hypothetical protein
MAIPARLNAALSNSGRTRTVNLPQRSKSFAIIFHGWSNVMRSAVFALKSTTPMGMLSKPLAYTLRFIF